MDQVWIPMVWSGASVVEVYKSLVDRKTTFDVNSTRLEMGICDYSDGDGNAYLS